MKCKLSLLIGLNLLVFLPACKKELQVPDSSNSSTQFHRLSGYEEVKDALVLSNGNSVLVGGKLDDAFIVVFNPQNEILWEREINKSGTDAFFTVAEMPNGDIVVAGHTNSQEYSTDRRSTDLLLVKYGSDGTQLFEEVYGTEYNDKPNDMLVDKNGDLLIVGNFRNHIQRTYAYKIKPDGKLVWKKDYQFGPYFNEANAICEMDNGNYLIGGKQSKSRLLSEIRAMLPFTFSIDANGDVLSYYAYESYVSSYSIYQEWASMQILKTPKGFTIVNFYFDFDETSPPCAQFLELNSNYSVANEKKLFGINAFKPFKIYPQADGTYLLTGSSSNESTFNAYGFSESYSTILKLDQSFEQIWSNYAGSEGLVQVAYTASFNQNRIAVQGLSNNLFVQQASMLSYFLDPTNGELKHATK